MGVIARWSVRCGRCGEVEGEGGRGFALLVNDAADRLSLPSRSRDLFCSKRARARRSPVQRGRLSCSCLIHRCVSGPLKVSPSVYLGYRSINMRALGDKSP